MYIYYVRFVHRFARVAVAVDFSTAVSVWHTVRSCWPTGPSTAPRSFSRSGSCWPPAASRCPRRTFRADSRRTQAWRTIPLRSARIYTGSLRNLQNLPFKNTLIAVVEHYGSLRLYHEYIVKRLSGSFS